jgi:hypothetical protein
VTNETYQDRRTESGHVGWTFDPYLWAKIPLFVPFNDFSTRPVVVHRHNDYDEASES